MPYRLRDIQIDEVSLVDQPANPKAKVVLFKRATQDGPVNQEPMQKGGVGLDVQEPTLKDRLYSLVKALFSKEAEAVSFDEALAEHQAQRRAAQVTEELWDLFWALRQSIESIMADDSVTDKKAAIAESVAQFQQAVTQQLQFLGQVSLSKVGRKISAERLARLKAMRDELSRLIEEAEKPTKTQKGGMDVADQVKGAEAVVPVAPTTQPDDVAKADLPEPIRKRLEELEKRAREADERAKRAEELLKAEREIRLKREFAEKAARYAPLGVDREKFAELLRKLSEKAPEEYQELEKALDRAAEAARASDALLAEIGKSVNQVDDESAWGRIQKMAQEKVAKSGGSLTLEKAIDEVMREHPELAVEYAREVRR